LLMITSRVEGSETFRFRTNAGIYAHARLFNNPCKARCSMPFTFWRRVADPKTGGVIES